MPVNLHSGQGGGCAVAADAGDAGGASLAAWSLLVIAGLAGFVRRRAARQPVRYTSRHG